MQQTTSSYYREKVDEVLRHIHSNLAEDLNVKTLSEKFGISFFYFHRILKAFLNEPLGSYINRIRLETAIKLIRYSDESLSDISARIGYNDLSSFSKAFSREFGLSPHEFKMNREIVLNTHIDYRINDSGMMVSDLKPKIITLPDKQVVLIRVTGEYGGKEALQAWDELLDFALSHQLLGWKTDAFSVYYDEPDEVGIENCRSDLCVATKKNVEPPDPIRLKTINGGKFAVFRYKGPYERLWELYDRIYREWLFSSEIKLRDLPSVEKYLNFSPKTKSEDLLTEIYIPIE